MASSKPGSFFLRSTSALSLNERFSQVHWDQLAQSRAMTFDSVHLQQRQVSAAPTVVLLVKEEPASLLGLQRVKQRRRTRSSVWTRLGWRQVPRRFSAFKARGFWSFRNKYVHRRWGKLRTRLRWCGLLKKQNAGRRLTLHVPSVGPAAVKEPNRQDLPTKKQLDAQLDDYMSKSKSRLDKQLDEYMSMSRRRLDEELDEYMLMAGDSQLQWD